ncbi:putative Transmembrane protein [Mycena venus]|uniref:Putative Transmembrane protein n=1 Tax=Mycena venus TaxID=2733690 RepID=A0A8H6Y095_9AGAR|nr:putative Transmembrane protein [Mycena venus]
MTRLAHKYILSRLDVDIFASKPPNLREHSFPSSAISSMPPVSLIHIISAPFARLSLFRIISFTLAGGDVFQTIPATYAFYKKQWVKRKLSPACFFYAVARYMTIISLVTNGIGFYGTHFTPATCRSFYMLPNVTAMLAGMAVQILVFIRTYAISGRSKSVWYGLGSVLLLGFPVQVFGITYHRDPLMQNLSEISGRCKGRVLHANELDWNIVYYSAHMTYDLIATSTATYFLVYSSRILGVFNLSNFVRRVLTQGLLYFIVVFLVNLWVVMEFLGVLQTGAASTLPLAIVLIAIQHLILSTQNLPSNKDTEFSSSQSASHNKNQRQSAIVFGAVASGQAIELQSSVSVQSQIDDRKTSRTLTDKYSNPSKGTLSDVTFAA